MKAAYVNTNPNTVKTVYAQKQHASLSEKTELLPGVYATPDDPALQDVEAIFSTWGMPCWQEEDIRRYLPKLKYVFYAAGTVQHFARPFLNCGVRVFSAWQANAVPVVHFAFSQIALALKGYFTAAALHRQSRSLASRQIGHYPGMFDVKVGLLGCGAIGSRVAEMLKMLDVEVLVFDPFLSDERAQQLNVQKTDMETIFAQCMVVSNHLANLPATQGIIRREHLLSMQPYSTFINTGRGAQLNEQDLFDMLTVDPTRCALLDVLTDEANTENNPLLKLENCFITPHIAGSFGNEVRRMAEYMIEDLQRVEANQPSPNEVTLAMLETMA